MPATIEKQEEITRLDQLDPNGIYTYADYLTWKFEETVELIKGKIYRMAAPIRYHQGVSRQLCGKFFIHFEGKACKFYAAPFDVRLYNRQKSERANKNIYSVIQPDICVVCDLTKLDRNGCLGAPDLMVEILSPGNSKKEMQTKYNLYEENGVREYWIVSPEHEYIAQYVLQANGKYAAPEYFFKDDAMPAAIFPDLILELEKVFID